MATTSSKGSRTSKKKVPSPSCAASAVSDMSINSADRTFDGSQSQHKLGILAQQFVELLQRCPDGIVDLSDAAQALDVRKRRLYDITGVLEAIGTISKCKQNQFQLTTKQTQKNDNSSLSVDDANNEERMIREKLKEAKETYNHLKTLIEKTSIDLHAISEEVSKDPHGWVTNKDIREFSCFDDNTLLAIRAPPGVMLEVPETTEHEEYEMRMSSDRGPIKTYLVEDDDMIESSRKEEAETEKDDHKASSTNDTPQASNKSSLSSPGKRRRPGFREICAAELEETNIESQSLPHFSRQMDQSYARAYQNGEKRVRKLSLSDLYSDDVHLESVFPFQHNPNDNNRESYDSIT